MRRKHGSPDNSPRPDRPALVRGRSRLRARAVLAALLVPGLAWADVQPVTQSNGPPLLPIPTWGETGLPLFTMPVGTPSVPQPPDPGPGGGVVGGGGASGGTQVDSIMESRSWGALAGQNASAIGVNPTAIAATCVLESGCMNKGALPGGTVSGAYQMTDGTYTSAIQRAAAQNPSLAGTIDTSLAGKLDPANQAIAAAQELKNAAYALQASGVSNPTVLDTRGYYNFGPAVGTDLARSPASRNMTDILSAYYSPAQMAANGVTPSTTVGQWRDSVTAKIGTAANQPVLL